MLEQAHGKSVLRADELRAMNLLLLRDEDFAPDGTARLRGRRLVHAREVLRVEAGDTVRAGRLRGLVGTATVLSQSDAELVLQPALTEAPPPRPGVDLILALPRPKALRKVLPAVASLGIGRLVLVNAARVEKSFFQSAVLDELTDRLCEGLEQARDTVPPEVLLRERLRPFVEDELPALFPSGARLLAHPGGARLAGAAAAPCVLAIGPEGGWVPFELALFAGRGFTEVSAGPRILRVEVAVPYLLGMICAS